jgi:hypothetical protein
MFDARKWHRDTAYFFVGLIISFSISGIALNHRAKWNPRQYVISSEEVKIELEGRTEFDEDFSKSVLNRWQLDEKYQSERLRGENLRIYFEGGIIDLNSGTGEGTLEYIRKRPVLSEMTLLHQTTNEAWIWYSDIFGLGMLFITITGMFIARGKDSFKRRGWKLALIGIIFPLIFLFFLV